MTEALREIACYFYADENASYATLLQDLRNAKYHYETNLQELEHKRDEIYDLAEKIHQVQSALEERAVKLLEYEAPAVIRQQSASHALLATQIEINLLKLVLLRAKAWKQVYSPSSSEKITGSHARLLSCYAHLRRDLDQIESTLSAYQDVMSLVGGDYAQIVEDYARVQRESEDCKRDLRRLGWVEEQRQ